MFGAGALAIGAAGACASSKPESEFTVTDDAGRDYGEGGGATFYGCPSFAPGCPGYDAGKVAPMIDASAGDDGSDASTNAADAADADDAADDSGDAG